MRKFAPLLFIFLTACATVVGLKLDDRFGEADPGRFDQPALPLLANAPDYWRDVRPVLDQRCVSCHACYDAPCQLNLSSYAGITRGATTMPVYSASRLLAADPTRLGIDAQSNREWRDKGFFPVLNERMQSPEANREAGVMHRLLGLKQKHPGPTSGPLHDDDIDTSLDRSASCSAAEGLDLYTRLHPTRGMPFGLPALNRDEHNILTHWLEAGAPYRPLPPLPANITQQVSDWEQFLNGDDNKSRLMARYIYEHWFAGQLWFSDAPGQYFDLVRSRSAPGQPIDLIATRRPYDDPGVDRVWYRLQRREATPVAKTLLPLQLDAARLERLKGWFLTPVYTVNRLPDYDPETAANPFISFRQLPLLARYRLMLDDAQLIIGGFMKGPVCRGQVALNVINDQFWVVFVSPNEKAAQTMQMMIDAAAPVMRMPSERESTTGLLTWAEYALMERKYTKARADVVSQLREKQVLPTIEEVWDGDGQNSNAALTVFRHFDSASVVRGLAGDKPQTTFLMGYPVLERMHYLLLAGFDVFGNVGHQLATRTYMDFLRMESEMNFLALLPMKDRQGVLDRWYRGRSEPLNRYFADASAFFPQETGIRYRSKNTLDELYQLIRQRTAPARDRSRELAASGLNPRDQAQFERLSKVRGTPASLMPEDSLILYRPNEGPARLIALVRNSAHTNVASMFNEEDRRLPEEDTLLAMNGIVGAYPNAIFTVDAVKLPQFVEAVSKLKTDTDLIHLTDRYGIRRTDPRFWPISDEIHALSKTNRPNEYGVLDYSRLENH